MSQVTSGLRALLDHPQVYRLSQRLIASERRTMDWVKRSVRVPAGGRVLDIGCGPADLLGFFDDDVGYVGFDLSAHYIDAARRRWGDRGTFFCARVDDAALEDLGKFDVVVARGVLHHLDDGEARALFRMSVKALRPGGRVVALDPCFVDGQSPIARYLISNDRGQNVRTLDGYRALADEAFVDVDASVRHDLNRLPYTHCTLEARTPRSAA